MHDKVIPGYVLLALFVGAISLIGLALMWLMDQFDSVFKIVEDRNVEE